MKEKVLEIAKKKCDGADVVVGKWQQVGVSYKANEIDKIDSNESGYLGLRIIKNGKLGISHTYDLLGDAKTLVDRAIENSKYGPRSYFDIPPKVSAPYPKIYDKSIVDIKPEEMKKFIETEMAKVSKTHNDILVDAGMGKSIYKERFLNSHGTDYTLGRTSIYFSIGGQRNKEGDFLQLYSGESAQRIENRLKNPTEELIRLFLLAKNVEKIETGSYDVYLHPRAFLDILGTIIEAMNGKSVLLGSSYLKDFLGKQTFDKKIDIYEDPMLDWAPNSQGLDDEGTKTVKKDIIKSGVPKQFIYDLQTAAKADVKATGNGFRGVGSQASPGFTNLIMKEGERTEGDIISSIKKGIYVRDTLGSHTNDPLSGNISLQLYSALKIENGKIIGRVKDAMLFLNVFDALKSNVVELSSERKWIGNKYLPAILLKNISITAR